MSELYEKSLLKLELDRVLEMLAERAACTPQFWPMQETS